MNRNQFVVILAILACVVAGGLGVAWWKGARYEVADSRVGQKLVSGFKIDDVAEIRITDAEGGVTLVRGDRGWSVKERDGFPADVEAIRDLLVTLAGLKVIQVEGLSEAIKPRMQLAAPGGGAKAEETGVSVSLNDRAAKPIAHLVLGKKTIRQSQFSSVGGDGIPSGRYVWMATDPQRVNIVNEQFSNVAAKPQQWLARDLMRAERVKSIVATGADGKEKWSIAKETEGSPWKLAGGGKTDPGKAQAVASGLYGPQLADVPVGVSEAAAGLDRPTRIHAQTFDGWTYELAIGKSAPEDRYYVKTAVTGSVPESRTPPAEEKAEDKEKADKAFAERKEALASKLEREKATSGRIVLVAKSTLEPFLRDRAAFLVAEKPRGKAGKK